MLTATTRTLSAIVHDRSPVTLLHDRFAMAGPGRCPAKSKWQDPALETAQQKAAQIELDYVAERCLD